MNYDKFDLNGRKYARLKAIRKGDKLQVDNGFTCLKEKSCRIVQKNKSGKYVNCSEGKHYLAAQTNKGGYLIGMYKI